MNMKKLDINAVANYFIIRDRHIEVTRLQKYLFYFEIFWFNKYKEFPFKSRSWNAFTYGPVNWEVWHRWSSVYKKLTKTDITMATIINEKVDEIYNEVVSKFKNNSAWELTLQVRKDLAHIYDYDECIDTDKMLTNKDKYRVVKKYIFTE